MRMLDRLRRTVVGKPSRLVVPWREAFESLWSPACLLAQDGTVLEVNLAWRRFMVLNGGTPESCGPGANYLTVCDSVEDPSAEGSIGFLMRAVFAGDREGFEFAYPCHAPTEQRWFIARVRRVHDAHQILALVEHHDVTAPQLALEISLSDRARFEALFRHNINAVLMVDATGSCVDANPAACSMLGASLSVIRSLKLSNHIEATAAKLQLPWSQGCNANLVCECVSLRRLDGALLVVECSTVREPLPNLHLVILQDITEKHRAMQAAKRSLQRYELLVDGIQDGVWDWDLLTGECFYSPHWLAMRGLRLYEERPNQQTFTQTIHPEDLQAVEGAMTRHLAGESEVLDVEYQIVIPGVGIRWVQDRGKVSRDSRGVATRFIGVSSDITTRRVAAAELAQGRADLRRSQRLGRVCSWSLDPASGCFTWSDELMLMLGMEPAAREACDWRILQPHLEPTSWEQLMAAQGDLEQNGQHYRLELVLQGRQRWLEARGDVLRDAKGRVIRLQGAMLDITDRHRAEQALRDQHSAELASQAKNAFLSQMNHELRTPLNAVIGFSELLMRDQEHPLTPGQLRHVGHISTAGKHLLRLISDLLDISAIERGEVRLAIEKVDAMEMVREVLATLAPEAGGRGIVLSFVPCTFQADVMADKGRLRQVLLNLVSNAMKYNRQGGKVQVSTQAADGRLRIYVIDDGWGMTEEQRASLFQAFNRLGRERSDVPGTGLGLVISQQLVTLMGGCIHVRSTVGVGSEFIVELPRPSC